MNRNSLFWGVVLIFAGFIWLLDTTGILGDINAWGLMWPLFIIGLGIWILWGRAFRRSPAAEHISIPLEGAASVQLNLNHGAGRLRLHGGAQPTDLVEGDFGGGLDIGMNRNGDRLAVKLSVPTQFFPAFWGPGWLDWSFALNGAVPIELEVNTGASESHLDMRQLQIKSLVLKTGASSTLLELPAQAGHTRVSVESGAATINLRIPEGVAGRIRTRSGLSSINVDSQRFPRIGDVYQSADYETAANKVDVDIQTGVGSVDIR